MNGRRIATLGATFLRRPRGAEWVADVLRVVALLSVPVAAIGWGPVALAVMMLALLGVVVPRTLGLRPGLDIAVVALSAIAGWSSVLGWYTSVFLWDKVVHVTFLTVLSAVAWVIGTDTSVIAPRRRAALATRLVLCGVAGLAIGSVWEMCEWVGHTQLDSSIRVGYDDTIGDLAADLAGGLLAGLLVPWFVGDRRVVIESRDAPGR